MCGIAGFVGRATSIEQSGAEVSAMCDAIWHRGPDEEGQYVAPGVAIGMRRLSIIDVSGGSQPIASEDGSIQVVFNGEIYNHRALRADLEHRHTFRSRTDTEVIVHLYEEHGDDFVHALRGMFAIAIWDARRERLILARDRLGIKPLYYCCSASGLAFGSELRALFALDDFPRSVSATAVTHFLALGYVPDPECIFQGVQKLPPGHMLAWERPTGVALRRYWSPVGREVAVTDERTCTEELQRLLSNAVESHLEADVPLGAFLSGGVDSSAVVSEMVRLSSSRVRTFSIGFEDPKYNEAPYASAVASALGTDHTQLIVRPSADALVEDVVRTFDEPFADASALPMLIVSQLARQHVTVALSGDGGDELFAGYTRYAEADSRLPMLPHGLARYVRALVLQLPHGTFGRNWLLKLSGNRRYRYATHVAHALAVREGGIMSAPEAGEIVRRAFDGWFERAAERDIVTQLTLVDMFSYLPGDILTKVDRASMRVSLEARVPLLDHLLVEFAVGLPGWMKRRDGEGKSILRKAIAARVPLTALHRPKHGFSVPLKQWLRKELRYRLDALLQPGAAVQAYVDLEAARRLVREHLSGRRDHSGILWRLIVLDLWLSGMQRGELDRPHSAAHLQFVAA